MMNAGMIPPRNKPVMETSATRPNKTIGTLGGKIGPMAADDRVTPIAKFFL